MVQNIRKIHNVFLNLFYFVKFYLIKSNFLEITKLKITFEI